MTVIPGLATEEATKAYADRIWKDNPQISPNNWRVLEGLTVSKIGFGTYRINGDAGQEEALKKSLREGLNLIDTSSNYMAGEAEKTVGKVLAELIHDGEIKREEVVLVTKGGYAQQQDLLYLHDNPMDDVVEMGPELAHCIHPDFLDMQLERSLERLGVEAVDVFMLHNPEYYLMWAKDNGVSAEDAQAEYAKRLLKAFVYLEDKAKEGKIGFYGVSSNTFVTPKDDPTHTDLAVMFEQAQEAAKQAWGRRKRPMFRCIQLPMNLLEPNAVRLKNTSAKIIDGEEEVSTLELASRMHLGVLVNRPLNAFPDTGTAYRLAEGVNDNTAELDSAMAAIQATEKQLAELLGGWPSVDDEPLLSFAMVGDKIKEGIINSVHFDHLKNAFIWPQVAYVNHSIETLKRAGKADAQQLSQLQHDYIEQAKALLEALHTYARSKDTAHNAGLVKELKQRLPENWHDQPLARIALNSVASTPGVTSVLCGLRREEYVTDALELMQKEDFADASKILGAK